MSVDNIAQVIIYTIRPTLLQDKTEEKWMIWTSGTDVTRKIRRQLEENTRV
jgi:hypothetical protein